MNTVLVTFMLALPAMVAGTIVALKPQGAVSWINRKAGEIDAYYERRRGTFGFFLKWTLRPGLWVYDKIFDKIEESAHEPEAKGALHALAVLYIAEFVLFLMYALVVLFIALVLLVIGFWIVAKVLNWDTPNVPATAFAGGGTDGGRKPNERDSGERVRGTTLPSARAVSDRLEECGCRRCGTTAQITKWSCGCVEVSVYNDRQRCAECTDFSGKREYCGKSGSPADH